MTNQPPLQIYFPVKRRPLQMEAGLSPLGHDLGQGARDQNSFLMDEDLDRYLDNKRSVERERHWVTWSLDGQDLTTLHHQAIHELCARQRSSLSLPPPELLSAWDRLEAMRTSKLEDHPASAEQRAIGTSLYQTLAMRVQEDIAVLARSPRSALVMGHVCAPSFWDPARIRDASFWEIHREVPGFPRDERVASRLEDHIATRGPFVRFVWTVCGDDLLDHHPHHPRVPWGEASALWYRVERQVTVPLGGAGSLFLIRTSVHPVEDLTSDQRSTLRAAIEVMPEEVAQYKGLSGLGARLHLLELISPGLQE